MEIPLVKKVKLERDWNNKDIAIREIELYEWKYWVWDLWTWSWVFNDSDGTYISFDSTWIGWLDGFDDNFNSDDYVVGSLNLTWSMIYYLNWYQDDDVIPRKTFFWNIMPNEESKNIFWSNYKASDFINKNSNNDDILNEKIWDITAAYLHLDVYNTSENIFDLKILEFDKDSYKNNFTLLLTDTFKGQWLIETVWYIQKNAWVLSLSKVKTWNEYEFDFKNKDYAVFLSNSSSWNLTYRLESETLTWTWIYINPINDSGTWFISVMSNHIIFWLENNYIWENFEIFWSK